MLLHHTGITPKRGERSHHPPSPSVAAVCACAEPGCPWCLCPDGCSVWPWEGAHRTAALPRLSADKWPWGQGQHRVRSWAQFPLSTPWLELLSARAAWAWHGQAQPARPPSPPAATARACWMEGRREEKQELLCGIASAQNWEKKWKLNKRDCF